MPRSATSLLPVLVLLLFVSAGCGGSSTTMGSSTRQMQSLIVTPSSADAQKSPNNQVQFMASATFNMAPMSMMSPAVRWSIGNPFATPMPVGMSNMTTMSAAPTIDGNGVAQCNGFVGIVTVEATAPADPSMAISQMNAMTRNVSGMAQLICP